MNLRAFGLHWAWWPMLVTGLHGVEPCRVSWLQYQPVNFNMTNQNVRDVVIPVYGGHASWADRQTLVEQGLVFHMKPFHTQVLTNTWGDRSILARFRPVRSGYLTGTVSFEQMIRVERFPVSNRELADSFPLSMADQRKYRTLLTEGDGVEWFGSPLAREALRVAGGSPRVAEASAAVMLWVRRSIRPGPFSGTSRDVFKNKAGDRASRLRLAAAMLRSLGLPVRFAKGEVAPADVLDTRPDGVLRFPGGRGDLAWMEVLSLSDSGSPTWIPMTLEGPLFMLPLNVMRSRSSENLSDLLNKEEGLLERYCQEVDVRGAVALGLFDHAPATPGIGVTNLLAALVQKGIVPRFPPCPDLFAVERDGDLPVAETLHLGTGAGAKWAMRFQVTAGRPVTYLELYLRRLDSQGAAVRLRLTGPGGQKRGVDLPVWALADGGLWRWTGFNLGGEPLDPGPWQAELDLGAGAQVDWGAQWADPDGITQSLKVDGKGAVMEQLAARFLLRAAVPPAPKKKEKP